MASVHELLVGHFRDDSGLQPLLACLEELAGRVAASELVHEPPQSRQPLASHAVRKAGGSIPARSEQPVARQRPSSEPTAGASQQSGLKVEEAQLPAAPTDENTLLPVPAGGHDWAALQGPVSEACCHFHSPGAKAAWKQWSLTPGNVSLVVGVAWWVVAHVFCPQAAQAQALKDYVFHSFARQYTRHVLTYTGAGKDLYHRLWQVCIASAAVNLLKGAFPKSAHKLDAQLEVLVHAQLVRWSAGLLPADLHPSDHELLGQDCPAAMTHARRHARTRNTAPAEVLSTGSAAASRHPCADSAAGAAGGSSADAMTQPAHGGTRPGQGARVATAPDSRAAARTSAGVDPPARSQHQQGTTPASEAGTAGVLADTLRPAGGAPLSSASPSVAQPCTASLSPGSFVLGVSPFMQAYSGTTMCPDTPRAALADGPTTDPAASAALVGGGVATASSAAPIANRASRRSHSMPQGATTVTEGAPTSRGTTAVGVAAPGLTDAADATVPAFQLEQASPALVHMFESHGLGAPRQQEAAGPGVLARTFGAGQRARRRPLDTTAPLPPAHHHMTAAQQHEQQQEDTPTAAGPVFMYSSLAADSKQRAADAVARYHSCKAETRREVAALKKQWLSTRSALQAQAAEVAASSAAKGMSDSLSHWIENDVDRMLRQQPPAAVHLLRPAASEVLPSRACKAAGHAALGATEAVLRAKGGASAGAAGLAGAAVTSGQAGYLSMTAATLAGAGYASASFLAAAANSANSARGPSMTRVMEPWSKMRAVEQRITSALSQARHGSSNDIAAHLAVQELGRQARAAQPGLQGNGQTGGAWKPAPLAYTRGTLDVRLRQEVAKYFRGRDLECYNV